MLLNICNDTLVHNELSHTMLKELKTLPFRVFNHHRFWEIFSQKSLILCFLTIAIRLLGNAMYSLAEEY
jgi:hypothetical protein